jgi:hypothetical protein
VKGGAALTLAARIGDERDARELLVPGVLAAAAELLGATELAVGSPTRDVLLVTDAAQKWQLVAAFATAVRLQHAAAGDEALFAGLLRAVDGEVVGVIELTTASLDDAARRLQRG